MSRHARACRVLGVLLSVVFIGGLALAAVPRGAGAMEHRREIVIAATSVEPPVLATVIERWVAFVNRSGGPVHVEFVGIGGHNVVQVSGEIRAVFHRPGRHPYVVHQLIGLGRPDLHGTVEVEDDPSVVPGPRGCPSITIDETCIEP